MVSGDKPIRRLTAVTGPLDGRLLEVAHDAHELRIHMADGSVHSYSVTAGGGKQNLTCRGRRADTNKPR